MDALPRIFILPGHLVMKSLDQETIRLIFAEDLGVLLDVAKKGSVVGHVDLRELLAPFGGADGTLVELVVGTGAILHIPIGTG